MKIEGMGQIKGIEQVQLFGQPAVKLTNGEILIARIERIDGDRVMLKNKEGALFMALMQGELGLAEGDMVEVAASGSGSGYVLYLVDIDKEASASGRQAEVRDTLNGTMAMMKANPGLDPKSAAFLIENSIPDTPENIAALSGLVRGSSGLGALLAEILAGLSREDQSQKPAASAQQLQPQAPTVLGSVSQETEGSLESASAGVSAASGGAGEQSAAFVSSSITGTVIDAAATDNNAALPTGVVGANIPAIPYTSSDHVPVSASDNGAAGQAAADPSAVIHSAPFLPSANDTTIIQADSKADSDKLVTQDADVHYNKEQIAEKIRSLFVKPDEHTGAQLKKVISETPERLNELKMMLKHSDKNIKDMYIDKAEQAQRQLDLMSGSRRFDYIQIPFFMKNGQEKTAELYVYRRARKKDPGEEGITVLVALDTQNIGRIETLIKTAGNGISLEFRLEQRQIQQEITKKINNLAKALETAGYRLKSVRVTKLETRTTVLNAGLPIDEDAGVKSGNVDVKI